MSQQYTSIGKQPLAFWAQANDCRLVDAVVRGVQVCFSKSSVFRMSRKAWPTDKASSHQFHSQTLRMSGPSESVLHSWLFRFWDHVWWPCFPCIWGFIKLCSILYFFSCHEFLSIKHCGRNGFMRSSLLFLPWIWGDQVMKRRGKIAFYSKIFELGVGHKHKWCIWGLFLLLSSIFFFSWTQENVSSMFLHVTFNLTVQWGQFVYQSHVSSFGKDGYNVPY